MDTHQIQRGRVHANGTELYYEARGDGPPLLLIAGGVGITPMMSMLRTAAHRGDPRPYRLIVVASAPQDLLFRHELAQRAHGAEREVALERARCGAAVSRWRCTSTR